MKFDKLEHSKRFVSNPGERMKPVYHGEVQEDGSIELVLDGYEDVYKSIQVDAEGCDVPTIVARAIAGDPTAFRKDSGFYADVVDMPKTYAEILNTVNAGRNEFEKLPLDLREKFDFSFEKWFATIGNKEWYENMGLNTLSNPEKVDVVETKEIEE